MTQRSTLGWVIGLLLVGCAAGAAFFTRETWLPWVTASADADAPGEGSPIVDAKQVRLTPQAQANLGLIVKPLTPSFYWRTAPLPGIIVDRPAHSDRGVVAPVTAVVTKVQRFPGDIVRPGEVLFTLRLLSESIHLSQSELFKSAQEIKITEEKHKRLAALSEGGSIPKETVLELESQIRRLKVASKAYRQELMSRGLMPEQIDGISEGKFVTEIDVKAPPLHEPDASNAPTSSEPASLVYEIQELKVDLGQQVQAGQTLCLLSNHQLLFIEGRAFRQETGLIEKSAKEGWPVTVEFMEDAGSDWPALEQNFTIRSIANTIDTSSRTFAFFLALKNQSRIHTKDGKSLLLWRYRPGQKVRLHVRVEKFENVFVLPADAVVREGPEAYVFRQNGDLFDRKPVHVLYQDRQHVVLANDGAVPPGLYVAQNSGAQINRVLKSQGSGLPPGFHMHADGSIHSNSAHK